MSAMGSREKAYIEDPAGCIGELLRGLGADVKDAVVSKAVAAVAEVVGAGVHLIFSKRRGSSTGGTLGRKADGPVIANTPDAIRRAEVELYRLLPTLYFASEMEVSLYVRGLRTIQCGGSCPRLSVYRKRALVVMRACRIVSKAINSARPHLSLRLQRPMVTSGLLGTVCELLLAEQLSTDPLPSLCATAMLKRCTRHTNRQGHAVAVMYGVAPETTWCDILLRWASVERPSFKSVAWNMVVAFSDEAAGMHLDFGTHNRELAPRLAAIAGLLASALHVHCDAPAWVRMQERALEAVSSVFLHPDVPSAVWSARIPEAVAAIAKNPALPSRLRAVAFDSLSNVVFFPQLEKRLIRLRIPGAAVSLLRLYVPGAQGPVAEELLQPEGCEEGESDDGVDEALLPESVDVSMESDAFLAWLWEDGEGAERGAGAGGPSENPAPQSVASQSYADEIVGCYVPNRPKWMSPALWSPRAPLQPKHAYGVVWMLRNFVTGEDEAVEQMLRRPSGLRSLALLIRDADFEHVSNGLVIAGELGRRNDGGCLRAMGEAGIVEAIAACLPRIFLPMRRGAAVDGVLARSPRGSPQKKGTEESDSDEGEDAMPGDDDSTRNMHHEHMQEGLVGIATAFELLLHIAGVDEQMCERVRASRAIQLALGIYRDVPKRFRRSPEAARPNVRQILREFLSEGKLFAVEMLLSLDAMRAFVLPMSHRRRVERALRFMADWVALRILLNPYHPIGRRRILAEYEALCVQFGRVPGTGCGDADALTLGRPAAAT